MIDYKKQVERNNGYFECICEALGIAHSASLTEMLIAIGNSTPDAKIQTVIDAHKKNKVGDDKLDYADDLVISTLERILNVESDESNTSIS